MKITCFKHGFFLFFSAIKLGFQLMRGACMLAKVQMPIVTVFGGREATEDNPYYKQAYDLSSRFVHDGMSVLTGGGPGIMYAANCGARSAIPKKQKKLQTLGIAVKGVDEAFENKCSPLLWVHYFFIRKWLLIRYALAFVVFPGGLGTADELFDVLNYMKHKRIPPLPVILIGSDYWAPIVDWMKDKALKEGFIKEQYMHFFIVTDSIDEAFSLVKKVSDQYKMHVK